MRSPIHPEHPLPVAAPLHGGACRPRPVASSIPWSVLVLGTAAAMLQASTGFAQPGAWPVKPIRIAVTISAGSAADILTRLVAEPMSSALGQQVLVENRPGAGGNIAGEYVARQAPDGYNLLMATISSHGINPSLYRKMPYDALKDFEPIMAVASLPNVLIVNPSLPVKTVRGLVQLAKSRPGEMAFSSGGNGTSHHLAAELLNSMTAIRTTHIPYRGTPEAVASVVRGEAAFMFPNASNAIDLAKAGKLRAVAIATRKRVAWWPELPTMIELGMADFEVTAWYGLVAPAGTSEPILRRLNGETQKAIEIPSVRESLARQGFDTMGGSAEEFRRFMRAEIDKWAKVVRASGATVN